MQANAINYFNSRETTQHRCQFPSNYSSVSKKDDQKNEENKIKEHEFHLTFNNTGIAPYVREKMYKHIYNYK